jgi:predicted nucleic acid-binding protein
MADFVSAQPLERLFVSTVTFAEIRFGIEQVADAKSRAELNDWLTHKLRPKFEGRVLPVSEVEEGRKGGHTLSQPDLFIGATALHHGLTVVSRDTDDYARANVAVFNPWSDPLPPERSGQS